MQLSLTPKISLRIHTDQNYLFNFLVNIDINREMMTYVRFELAKIIRK